MSEKIIIHCDKCSSTSVLHEQVIGPPQEKSLTMTEMANRPKTTTTYGDYNYKQYRMVCKDCGHIVKYWV